MHEHARKDRLGELVHVLTKRGRALARSRKSIMGKGEVGISVTFTTEQSLSEPHDTTRENE